MPRGLPEVYLPDTGNLFHHTLAMLWRTEDSADYMTTVLFPLEFTAYSALDPLLDVLFHDKCAGMVPGLEVCQLAKCCGIFLHLRMCGLADPARAMLRGSHRVLEVLKV